MKYKMCLLMACWSQTLSIILGVFTDLFTSEIFKNQQNQICPYTTASCIQRQNKNMCSFSCPRGPQSQLPGGPRVSYLHDTNLNILSAQTRRGQELLQGHFIKKEQIRMMAVFSSSFMKRVINFMCNPKLAHILVDSLILSNYQYLLLNLIEPKLAYDNKVY